MKTLNQLDLNLLKALAMLLDERNVTRAAQRLGVTQPAMSAMLNRLRDAFGDPLNAAWCQRRVRWNWWNRCGRSSAMSARCCNPYASIRPARAHPDSGDADR